MLAQLGDQLDQLGLLVGERALDFAQRAVFELEFFFGGAQLLALGLVASLQREDGRGLLAELLPEQIDGVGLLAELGKLRRRLGLHLRHAHFEAAGRHGEFGAQLVLVGADFGNRQRRRRFEAAHGQAHGAVMNQRDEQQSEQRRNQETDAEIHDRFDHETTPPSASRHPAMRIRTAPHSPAVNLNRLSPPRHCLLQRVLRCRVSVTPRRGPGAIGCGFKKAGVALRGAEARPNVRRGSRSAAG